MQSLNSTTVGRIGTVDKEMPVNPPMNSMLIDYLLNEYEITLPSKILKTIDKNLTQYSDASYVLFVPPNARDLWNVEPGTNSRCEVVVTKDRFHTTY